MSEFKQHWDWAESRGKFQQEYSELEHVYNLMKDCNCESYLEVGSAEGNSLYILGHTTKMAAYIDIGEPHTDGLRAQAIEALKKPMQQFIGDSTTREISKQITSKHDCILIDGGHDFATVLSDSIMYAPLATKYVFWHDIQLPQVKLAVDWFVSRRKLGKYTTFINSPSFGYGILEIGQ